MDNDELILSFEEAVNFVDEYWSVRDNDSEIRSRMFMQLNNGVVFSQNEYDEIKITIDKLHARMSEIESIFENSIVFVPSDKSDYLCLRMFRRNVIQGNTGLTYRRWTNTV